VGGLRGLGKRKKINLSPFVLRYFYQQNPRIAIAMILIVFLAPFVGIFVKGLIGAVWGVGLSVLGYYFAPYAVRKLRE